MRVRFAPSPTGHLHVGNARTAIFNYLLARHSGGTFILRIEDTDIDRHIEGAEETIYEDLRWLGLTWDEGPDTGGTYGPYRQSERMLLYNYYSNLLVDERTAYFCFCSDEALEQQKKEMLARGEVPRYSGRCATRDARESRKRVAAGQPAAVRIRLGKLGTVRDLIRGDINFSAKVTGDPVIMRSDGRPTYNFAVVIDDAFMRVTHVVRGEDHLSNTPLQVIIYESIKRACERRDGKIPEAIGDEPSFDQPCFAHLPMILGPDGSRLSKRHGATSISYFKEKGYLPEAFFNYLSLLGWSISGSRTIATVEELIEDFDLKRISKASAIFDHKKLDWMNAHYIRSYGSRKILALALKHLKECKYISDDEDERVRQWSLDLLDMFLSSLNNVSSIVELSRPIFKFHIEDLNGLQEERKILTGRKAFEVLKAFAEELKKGEISSAEEYAMLISRLKQRTNAKGKELFHPLRVSVSLCASGPELDRLIPLIGRGDRLKPSLNIPGCRERVEKVIDFIGSQ